MIAETCGEEGLGGGSAFLETNFPYVRRMAVLIPGLSRPAEVHGSVMCPVAMSPLEEMAIKAVL